MPLHSKGHTALFISHENSNYKKYWKYIDRLELEWDQRKDQRPRHSVTQQSADFKKEAKSISLPEPAQNDL